MKKPFYDCGPLAAKDALGRRLPMPDTVPPLRGDRFVGMFYFVNLQFSGCVPGDNTQIAATTPEAFQDPDHEVWKGGACYWGKPLFGYYAHDDEWVIRRHVMMLIQAGVDFIVFDTTNLSMHAEVSLKVLEILSQFIGAGWNAPRATYYTNSESGLRVREIYDTVYKPGKYRDTWFMLNDKPMIIARPEQCDEETQSFFTFRRSQWPTEPPSDGGFPWMAFERPQNVYRDTEGRPEVVSVSVAQHPQIRFGDSAFYGEASNRGRSYHTAFYPSANDFQKGAVDWGYNFSEQWEHALRSDPRMVFVTGWNEWVAGVMTSRNSSRPIVFVDTASQEFSRDIEPMEGGHFDNYYLQLCDYIRRYKGMTALPEASGPVTVDISAGFKQWNAVLPEYRGFPFFEKPRSHTGMDGTIYETESGCNVFDIMKIARDDNRLFVYARCFEDIAPYDFTNRMNLFLRVHKAGARYDAEDRPAFLGYHYLLNHECLDRDATFLYECLGGWRWKPVCSACKAQYGKEFMAAIPLERLGLAGEKHFELHFKWADRLKETETAEDFYQNGCSAPYGRMNFVYRV